VLKTALFCGGSAMAVALSLCSSQAFAATATAAAGATAAAADNTPAVGELLVVATRREEKIENVPVAITAFSGQQRSLVGIATVQDLTDYTPGLSYTAVSNRPYIRGVGRNTDNLSTASAVATYYNGVYYGANASTLLQKDDLFIGNIEVDRGPQNGLHGSNADGGTMDYTSQRPTDHFYAEARGGVGNYGDYFAEGVVSGPITDNIKFRLGANYTDMQGGYFDNLEPGQGAQGGNGPNGSSGTSKYFEGQLEGKFGNLDAWGMISAGDFATNYHTVANIGYIPDSLTLATNTFEPSSFFALCGLPGVPASLNGAGCSQNGGQTVVPGSVIADPITANQFPGNNPGNLNPRNFLQEFSSTNYQNGNLALATNITYHFPSVDVTYLGGYQTFDYELNYTSGTDSGVRQFQLAGPPGLGDLTIDPTPNLTYFAEHDHYWSHEVDFTSTWDSPFQYVAGAYWYHESYDQPVDAGVEPDQPQMGAPQYLVGVNGTCPGQAAFTTCAAPLNPSHAYSTSITDLKYDSYAGFVAGNYKFNDQWRLNGDIRYTVDHKYGVQQWRFTEFDSIIPASVAGAYTPNIDLTGAAVGADLASAYPGAGKAYINSTTGFAERDLDATWTAVTGDGTLTWTPEQGTLFYGKYARGYKSGGFSTYTIGANPETLPEYVDSFEVGTKKEFGHNLTINGAAFYYNYYNDQVPLTVATTTPATATVPASTLLTPELYNLPLVHDYGVELEGVWRPIDPLTLSVEYSYLNTSIANAGGCIESTADSLALQPSVRTAGCAATSSATAVTQNIKGNQLPEAPPNKITANALYSFNLPTGKLTLSGTVIWKDTTYASVFNAPEYKQDPYSQVNLRATYASGDGHYNIIVFCDNLFNTLGYDAAVPAELAATGASPGVPASEDIINGYSLTPPRTFGIQLQYRWQ
jgi:iron complex outermembrane receptor protein